MMKNKLYIITLLMLTAGLLGGCGSLALLPKSAMPTPPQADLYGTYTPATRFLDCLSVDLSKINNSRNYKVMVGELLNNSDGQLSNISLPKNFRPFVEKALSRLTTVYYVYEARDLTGLVVNEQPMTSGLMLPPGDSRAPVIANKIKADLVITGSYMVQNFRSAESEGVLYALGLGAQAKAYDVKLALKVIDAGTRKILIPPVDVRVRLYWGGHSASAFYLSNSGDLSTFDARFIQFSNELTAFQYLADYATGTLIRDLSAGIFRHSFSFCDKELNRGNISQVPSLTETFQQTSNSNFELFRKGHKVCVKAGDLKRVTTGRVKIVWRQYASNTTSIQLGRPQGQSISLARLNPSTDVCLPAGNIYPTTQTFEMRILDDETHFFYGGGFL